MKSGIYKIENNLNKKVYIGSTKNFNKRFQNHKRDLINNCHHSNHLQNAWNKYTKNTFSFIIIEYVEIENLLIREQYYLDSLNPEYNISKYSSAPMQGRKHSFKSKQKMSGKIPWNKGIPRTDKEKQLISQSQKEQRSKWSIEKIQTVNKIMQLSNVRYWKGKQIPELMKSKMRNTWTKKLNKILCFNNKIIYDKQLDAAKALNIKQGHISEVVNNKRHSASGFRFKYV